MRLKNDLIALVGIYHKSEAVNDDLTMMASYDKAIELGYTESEWKEEYNLQWPLYVKKRKPLPQKAGQP